MLHDNSAGNGRHSRMNKLERLQIKLAKDYEEIVEFLAHTDVEPTDAERILAAMEQDSGLPSDPRFKDRIRDAVTEAIKRRDTPKPKVPPGHGKTSL